MSVQLLPRLVAAQSERLLSLLPVEANVDHRPSVQDAQQSAVTYAAVGGQPVGRQVIAELHGDVIRIAKDCGYPSRGDQLSRARFDSVAARALATYPALNSGEAMRNDFWAYMATILLWRVALWRFPAKSGQIPRDRLLGGVRNVFQRLWLRGRALDRGSAAGDKRWDLLDALTEDALVQITERPSVGGYSRLARMIAEQWVCSSKQIGRGKMENVMRLAVKRIRLRNEVIAFAVLSDSELSELIAREFERAISDLKLD